MIKYLWNKIRRRQPEPPIQPITYGIHVFMRQAGERLCRLEARQRATEERMLALEKRIDEMDDGTGQAVTAVRMEFETLVEAWKTSLQNQIDRHDVMLGEIVGAVNQLTEDPIPPNSDIE